MIIQSKHEKNWADLDFGPQSEHIDKKASQQIELFFKLLRTKGAAIALDDLLSSNSFIDTNITAAANLRKRLITNHETSGRFTSHRLLRKKFLVDDLGVYSYLVKYEKCCYRFMFTFYNNDSSIKLYKFSFDDNLDTELEKSLKA